MLVASSAPAHTLLRRSLDRLAKALRAVGVCVCAISCGGGDGGGSDGPGGGTPIPIRNGQRLGWTQSADSPQALRAYAFRLYVDASLATLIDPRCDQNPSDAGYECSGGLPAMGEGRHLLELTSVVNGVESLRSALLVTLSTSAQVSSLARTNPATATDPATQSSVVCAPSANQGCYSSQILASGLDRVTMITTASDGRLLLTEGGARVRVIADGALVQEPALEVADPRSRIVGLAVDTRSSDSQSRVRGVDRTYERGRFSSERDSLSGAGQLSR